MTKIEVQYFHGCPHSDEMIKKIKQAISISNVQIDYRELVVDTPEKANQYKFRGSPTVLINGVDIEGLAEPSSGNLACRYYKDGLPSVETITKIIENSVKGIGNT